MRLQMFYDIVEDRLRLTISAVDQTQSWWLTRQMTRLLAEAISARLNDDLPVDLSGKTRELALAMGGEEALQKNPITSEAQIPDDGVSLLVEIRHGKDDEDHHVMVLVDRTGDERGLTFDSESLYALMELLRSQLRKTPWDLALNWPDFDSVVGAPVPGVH